MERSGKMTIEEVLAIPIIAFANADGGTVAIGISDKTRRIEGVDYDI